MTYLLPVWAENTLTVLGLFCLLSAILLVVMLLAAWRGARQERRRAAARRHARERERYIPLEPVKRDGKTVYIFGRGQ